MMKFIYRFIRTKKLMEMHDIALWEEKFIKQTNIALELWRRAEIKANKRLEVG